MPNKFVSLFSCPVCINFPDHIKSGDRGKDATVALPKEVGTFIVLWEKTTDDYVGNDITEIIKIMKCPLCGTYYQYFDDYGDSNAADFEPGWHFLHLRRWSFTRAIYFFKEHNKTEHKEIKERYDGIVREYGDAVNKGINPNFRNYAVELLTDYYIINDDWNGLVETLLSHKDKEIVFKVAMDLIFIFGKDYAWSIRDRTPEMEEATIKFLSKHKNEFLKTIAGFLSNEDTRFRAIKTLETARYYKLGIQPIAQELKKAEIEALFFAIKNNHEREVNDLTRPVGSLDINTIDVDKKTALMAATEEGNREIIKLLIQRGAKANKAVFDCAKSEKVREFLKAYFKEWRKASRGYSKK